MRWSARHSDSALRQLNCLSKQSVTATQGGFRQQFHRRDVPSRITLMWVSMWRQEGSVKDSKPQRLPPSVRTPDNVESVMDAVLLSPRWSARRQALPTSRKGTQRSPNSPKGSALPTIQNPRGAGT